MKKELIELRINGRSHELAIEPSKVLLDALRQDLQLTGSKRGCDDSSCGACTVLLDGTPMLSCTMLAASCEGHEITTIEGVSEHGSLAEAGATNQCQTPSPSSANPSPWLTPRARPPAQASTPTTSAFPACSSARFCIPPTLTRASSASTLAAPKNWRASSRSLPAKMRLTPTEFFPSAMMSMRSP